MDFDSGFNNTQISFGRTTIGLSSFIFMGETETNFPAFTCIPILTRHDWSPNTVKLIDFISGSEL